MSCVLSRLHLTLSLLPLLILSTNVTSAPSLTSSSTKWLPMKLAPPVTRTVLSFQYSGIDLIKIQLLREIVWSSDDRDIVRCERFTSSGSCSVVLYMPE